MREKGVPHDSYTLPILNGSVVLLESGKRFADMIHSVAVQMGFESDVYFCNTMIEAYVKSGCFENALKMFGEMPHKDLVSWTSMISGYIGERNVGCASGLFREMRKEVEPNAVTILVMLQICSSVFEGRQIQAYAFKSGFLVDQSVKNSILKIYADVGDADDAETLFDEIDKRDVVSWNIMMSLYSSEGNTLNMTNCFRKIWNESKPSIETLTLFVSGLAEAGNLSQVWQIHCLSIKSGLCDDILRTSLLDFYAKCADLEASAQLFTEVLYRNCITWGAMMSGFIENGYFREAIELFWQMLAAGVQPMAENMRNLLLVYTHMGALQFGKSIHGYLVRNSFFSSNEENRSLETSTLNMYIRCGSICAARTCFDRILVRDRVTWASMIEGCAIHGKGFEALELFHQMVEDGIKPNSVTFISLLSACRHSGLLHEGCELFCSMKSRFGIDPELDHYTCIVDLLGRSDKTKEALAIILKFVIFPDSRIWGALLAASRVNENRKLGEYAAERLFQLEPDNVGYHTVFSNVQASAEKWDVVEEVRSSMKNRNLTKHPGWSCIEAKGTFHGFVSGDRSHRQTDEIYDMMECLGRNTLETGNLSFNWFPIIDLSLL
ncbi:unnamed protein product [Fraxinus pennsylvanica]|uniref:Pentatricopeptide repeat-containing protein n=1 Tax=Fraxinus pennsylvanica TaxID=56036 RepID=A0AAD1Z9R9_9LAMI|nr:unnamed protein product [Fraxinus pennsylvanica]